MPMSNRTSLRMRVLPRYPARITGTNGLTVVRDSADLVIKPDFGSLTTVPAIDSPTATYFWGWDQSQDSYSRITFQNLVENIQSVIIGPTTAAMEATSPTADQIIYFTGTDAAATTSFTAAGRGLIGAADAAAQRTLLALGTSATLNVGTAAGTVAAGNDTRIVNAVQPSGLTPYAPKASPTFSDGRIALTKPSTGTSLTSDVTVDAFQDFVRIFAKNSNGDFAGFALPIGGETTIRTLGGELQRTQNLADLTDFGQARQTLAVFPYVADRTTLKSVNVSKDVLVLLREASREGVFQWTLGDFSTQVAADTAEGMFIKANAVAASVGAWVRIFSGRPLARWFGPGHAGVQAAFQVANDVSIDVNTTVTANATWPNGKTCSLYGAGQLTVSTGVTLTVRAVVESPARKIFNCIGTGKVIGIRRVLPEWWGALGDSANNDQPALQAAHDCTEQSASSDGGRPEVVLRGGATYALGSQLTLRPTSLFNLKFVGSGPIIVGTRFTAPNSFSTANGAAAIRIAGNSDSSLSIAAFDIGNFSVVRALLSPALFGVMTGGDGTTTNLIGVQQSPIHDIYCENFTVGFRIANCRLVDFNRCSSWSLAVANSIGFAITVDSNTSFTGDLNFNGCQSVVDGTNGGKCVSITAPQGTSGASGGQVKGIRFNNFIFYKGSRFLEIIASNGGAAGDIWVNPGCQFDGFGNNAVYIESNGAGSTVDDIHILHSYVRGINDGQIAIRVLRLSGGSLRDIFVEGNWIASLGNGARAIAFDGVTGGTCARNKITDIDNAGGEAILIDNSVRISCDGNTLNRSGAQALSYLLTLGAGTTYSSAQGNISSTITSGTPVRNLGGGTNVVASNV
jgi:hypothetical protein